MLDDALIDALADLAIAAGRIAISYRGKVPSSAKDDGSPVTIADHQAEETILEGIRKVLPGVPVVSEEAACIGKADVPGDDFLLVDALDGTKEFLAGSGEFTVNIGLIHRGVPVAGVLYAPALARLWLAGEKAQTCDVSPDSRIAAARNRTIIHARKAPAQDIVAIASLRHNTPETDAYLEKFPVSEKRIAGSSLKFCQLAEGKADIYPRFSPTCVWDTAAGHAVLLAAGGVVVTEDGAPLTYGNCANGYLNPYFIAAGDKALLSR